VIAIRGLVLVLTLPALAVAGSPSLSVIPRPASVELRDGMFPVSASTMLTYFFSNEEVRPAVMYLKSELERRTGMRVSMSDAGGGSRVRQPIFFNYYKDEQLGEEGYLLDINPDRIEVNAHDDPGFMNGARTLLQMLQADSADGVLTWQIPCSTIRDWPRFGWRGMHLDVSRHFFPPAFIKRYIDLLAMYKMNRFHWHLTDDQGWRIEIRGYPKLTEVGAWRNGSMIGDYSEQRFDSVRYGGFYTQDEVRDIVAYAGERNVMVIPEIEMPGHALAALAAYPGLSCTGGPFDVGMAWGVYEDVFCPREETFRFVEGVLGEVIDLFPGPYVHIGGDECPKTRWKTCDSCQSLIRERGLHDEEGLQSYFIRRVESFLNSHGKRLIGWDEILEGGLAPNATVMSWRGTEGGTAAAREGHDAVMSPGSHCYFDYFQGNPRYEPLAIGGYTPLEKVYAYEPVPDSLTGDETEHILGAQGNVWTEYITTTDQVEYMIIPRMLALAEVVWCPPGPRDYAEFTRRIGAQFPVLEGMNVHPSLSMFQVSVSSLPDPGGKRICCLLCGPSGADGIFYSVDGSDPNPGSRPYTVPFEVDTSMTIRAAYFENGKRIGEIISQALVVSKSTGRPVRVASQPDPKYSNGDPFRLVDGIRGDPHRFGMDWLGFRGHDLDAMIDLGAEQEITCVTVSFFEAEGSWIYLPRNLEVSVSTDGDSMFMFQSLTADEIRNEFPLIRIPFPPVRGRYVHIRAEHAGVIPEGKQGAGQHAWLFVDEIVVE